MRGKKRVGRQKNLPVEVTHKPHIEQKEGGGRICMGKTVALR